MKFLFLAISFSAGATFSQVSDTTIIKKHFEKILSTPQARNYKNINALNSVADYIFDSFKNYGDSTVFQEYMVGKQVYKNVITSFGTSNPKRVIVGAHYDVCENQPGADDNASGVIGLLELARMLKGKELNYRIDLVAYTLEEPPFFRSPNMGSYVHANYLFENKIDVYGMICLEMIGYFSDDKKSQNYPLKILKLFYGSKGDFITVVRKFSGGKFARVYKRKMKKSEFIKTKSIQAPERIRGIDFSDHLNYWAFGYSSVLITNTGFYRNQNYHRATDTFETIDIEKMSFVIDEVCRTLLALK